MTLKMGDIVIARFTNSDQRISWPHQGRDQELLEDRVPGTCLAERSTWSGLPNRNHLCAQLLGEQSNCESSRKGEIMLDLELLSEVPLTTPRPKFRLLVRVRNETTFVGNQPVRQSPRSGGLRQRTLFALAGSRRV